MGAIFRGRKCYTGKVKETNPLEWKLFTTSTSGTTITLPTEYTELFVEVITPANVIYSGVFLKSIESNQVAVGGYMALGVSSSGGCFMVKNSTSINVNQIYQNGASVTGATVKVYYR